jgi:predicted phosphodiesterase
MSAMYENFISQNCAPKNCTRIVVYRKGEKKGIIKIPHNMLAPIGEKLYSFGVVSDVHIQYSTAESDFITALSYFAENGCEFVCDAGDMTANGTNVDLQQYADCVENNSSIPVYVITGNHDTWDKNSEGAIANRIQTYTGHPLYYSFTYGNDVFIMLGIKLDGEGLLFAEGELQWFYETLEANRNKRCFVFEHVRPQDACGNAYGIYANDIWGGTEATVFESLLRHYKNIILFHGHSHLKFGLQTKDNLANYDNVFGCHSIHIPSISVPRTGNESGAVSREELYAQSEGYVVDVYDDAIMLKGRNFILEKFLPIATYKLDTTRHTIEPNTFADSTGTITV